MDIWVVFTQKNNMKTMHFKRMLGFFVVLALQSSLYALHSHAVNPQKGKYFLYCHMSDKGQWTAFAVSKDAEHWQDIIGGDSIFSSHELAGIEGGTRDAYICRSHDCKRYLMVTTDMNNSKTKALGKKETWDNYGINLLTSDDLIHWKSTTFDYRKGTAIFSNPNDKSVYNEWSTINRVWAPQIFWDDTYTWPDGHKGGYFIYYSMWNRGEEKYDRMYYSYADESFTKLTVPGEDGWRIAYIEYSSRPRNYRICRADKFMRNFNSPENIKGVTAPQHGSFMRITKKEYKRLLKLNKR